MMLNKISWESEKAQEMWIENNYKDINNLMKYNKRDKVYIHQMVHISIEKVKYTHIKDNRGIY